MTVTLDFDVFNAIRVVGLGLVTVAVLVSVVMGWKQLRRALASRKYDSRTLAAMRARWEEVMAAAALPGEMGRKQAIMEADKLLDSALKSLAMPGQTLGERLKFAQYKYPQLREVWYAHRVRNQIAHETSFHLDNSIAQKALREYKKALTMLGAI